MRFTLAKINSLTRKLRARWTAVFLVIAGGADMNLHAQMLRLDIRTVAGQEACQLHDALAASGRPRVSRLDFLLSGLALRRADGTWLESEDWFSFLSASPGMSMNAEGSGTPEGHYTGIRFHIGVNEAINKADPHIHAADHPLNPQVNGLHWGWAGGFIFLAIEGHYAKSGGEGGFSYHIANAPQLMTIELPVEFIGGRPITLAMDFDLQRVLAGIDFERDGTSTHSREGDALALRIKENIERAFRMRGVSYDVYQTRAFMTAPTPLPVGTHPLAPQVTTRFPQVPWPEDNPLTEEGAALGRRLFHDTRLSGNDTQSCASCHDATHAFSDPRRFSIGAEGQSGRRNAMPLFNLAWHKSFFWDGRAPTLRQQVLMPIQEKAEMNETLPNVIAKLQADAEIIAEFSAAFGTPAVNEERLAKALEQFLLTLISQESKFDRAARKVMELTESEKRGLRLFVTEFDPKNGVRGADCFHCHGGMLFTSQQFANNGLDLAPDDTGLMAVTKNPADRGKFKVPSLRNVALTAPYMHDGRFSTLEEVVEHYSGGVHRSTTLDPNLAKHPVAGIQLTTTEKADLVAFLRTLSDPNFSAHNNASSR